MLLRVELNKESRKAGNKKELHFFNHDLLCSFSISSRRRSLSSLSCIRRSSSFFFRERNTTSKTMPSTTKEKQRPPTTKTNKCIGWKSPSIAITFFSDAECGGCYSALLLHF